MLKWWILVVFFMDMINLYFGWWNEEMIFFDVGWRNYGVILGSWIFK